MMGVYVFYIWHTPRRVSPFFRLQRKIEFRLKLEGGEKKNRKARGRKLGAVVQSDRCEWPTIYFDKRILISSRGRSTSEET